MCAMQRAVLAAVVVGGGVGGLVGSGRGIWPDMKIRVGVMVA